MSVGPSRSDWQGAFALFGVSVDYSHIERAEEEYMYRPLDEPKLFNDRRRCAQHGGRLADGSYYSWVNGTLWLDSALKPYEYKWDSEDLISFLDLDDQDDPLFDKVTWFYLCAEFQLGEQYVVYGFCEFPSYSDNYTFTIVRASDALNLSLIGFNMKSGRSF
jgi:hypothetical protein